MCNRGTYWVPDYEPRHGSKVWVAEDHDLIPVLIHMFGHLDRWGNYHLDATDVYIPDFAGGMQRLPAPAARLVVDRMEKRDEWAVAWGGMMENIDNEIQEDPEDWDEWREICYEYAGI